MINKLASSIYNDVVAGLVGITSNPTISMDQLEQDIIDERLQIIKEYSLKNIIPKNDLLMAIRCIVLDKTSIDQCPVDTGKNLTWHFQIPQLVNDFGKTAVDYIGTSDRKEEYSVYTNLSQAKSHKNKRRGCDSPFVYIETAPNCTNMYDAWVFNLPTAKVLTFVGIIKDPRQLEVFSCCAGDDLENYSFISNEVKKRLTEKKLRYYRSFYHLPTNNDQSPK